jgi:glycine/D-amino acid oxidase-like deaminating enzyme
LATNAWTAKLLKEIPIVPVRGQVTRMELDKKMDFCMILKGDDYIAPANQGCVFGGLRRFSPTQEWNQTDDSSIHPDIASAFPAVFEEYFGKYFQSVR